jgi:prophage tail gpP-like protein
LSDTTTPPTETPDFSITNPVKPTPDPVQEPEAPVTPAATPNTARGSTNDDLILVMDGQKVTGWSSVRFARSCERFPSSFDAQVTEKDPTGEQVVFMPFKACDVFLGTDRVSSGYIDAVHNTLDATNHIMSIFGRSKCEDLVDCSAEFGPNHSQGAGIPKLLIQNTTLKEIAEELCAPYGIDVVMQNKDELAHINFVQITVGDKPYDIIERIARFQHLLVYDDTFGNLVISSVGFAEHSSGFVLGQNIQAISVEWRFDQRYSEIDVLNQTVNGANHDLLDKTFGKAVDPNIRHRRLFIFSEAPPSTPNWAQDRADWENARRYGRSQIIRVQVDSWRDSNHVLWTPNNYVTIDAPGMRLEHAKWIIADVVFSKSLETGTIADLVLMPPESFTPEQFNLTPLDAALPPEGNQPDAPPSPADPAGTPEQTIPFGV